MELLQYFGLIGTTNECQALEASWKDPYNKHEIKESIKEWLKRKLRKKPKTPKTLKPKHILNRKPTSSTQSLFEPK
jgi:hypothetical protein